MKIKNLIATAALLVAISAAQTHAISSAHAKKLKEAVLSVPVPEIPGKAAELVLATDAEAREDVAVTIVRAVISKHRGAAPIVVSAISKAAPEVSAAVAKAAIVAAPEAKAQIQVAAASVAPSQSANVAAINNVAAPTTVVTAGSPAPTVSPAVEAVVGRAGAQQGNPSQGSVRVVAQPIKYQGPAPTPAPAPVHKTGPRTE